MRKFIALCLSVIMIFLVFAGCSKETTKLVGSWQIVDGHSEFSRIEFFDNGSYDTDVSNYEGRFTVSGNRLNLQGILTSSLTYIFEVSDNTLTLYDTDGDFAATFEMNQY